MLDKINLINDNKYSSYYVMIRGRQMEEGDMKRKVVVGCAAFFLAVITLVTLVAPARSGCPTQGALAVALAQLLGLASDKTTPQAAAEALRVIGIEPTLGWKLNECVGEEVVLQLDTDLKKAIAAGTVAVDKSDAVAAALDLLQASDLALALNRSNPEKAFKPVPAIGGHGEQERKTASPVNP